MNLSLASVRAALLAAQGLHALSTAPATKADVLTAIRRMAVLQIDTIHVVARSPYLVLWSRLGEYEPRWLDELLAEGAIFEGWSHEASFLPIEDYGYNRRLVLAGLNRSSAYIRRWIEEHRDAINAMLVHVRAHGPVRSSDFARTDGQQGAWWNWKAEKMALEMLFATGDLMIARRHNFQRIYDLRERVLPAWDDTAAPPLEETRRALALLAVRALGVTKVGWVADYFRTAKRDTLPVVRALAAEGQLLSVQVEGWNEPGYVHPDNGPLVERAAAGGLAPTRTTLLSPFDPIVWDRARALDLFGFDYRIECYTPAPKRRYGYFTLPVLHRSALVGRLDAKAHRAEGRFEVKALYLEPGVPLTGQLVADLADALRACAAWHRTPAVDVRWTDPPELAALLRSN
ncbi:MAG: YcaQ family DNA glycosylase [Chloroflexales bacterium]|nr:YcaQ family DNA glycosylase [Chloroflexales bacterium]